MFDLTGALGGPLESVGLKLARGASALDELYAEIRAWLDRKPFYIRGEIQADEWTINYYVDILEPVPKTLGVIVGDWAHNARSALDHSVAALVEAGGGTVGDHHQFPITHGEKQWSRAVVSPPDGRKSWLEGVAQPAVDEIFAVQPFNQNEKVTELKVLAAINNADKHRSLNGAIAVRDRAAPLDIEWDPAFIVTEYELTNYVGPNQPFKNGQLIVSAKPSVDPLYRSIRLGGTVSNIKVDAVFAPFNTAAGGLWRIHRYVVDMILGLSKYL